MTSTSEKDLYLLQKQMLQEQRRIKLRRLGRNRVAVIGTLIVLVMAVIAIAAPLIATHDPYAFAVADRLQPPSAQHLFGTDSMGQDVFSRVIYGTRTSMIVGLIAYIYCMVAGSPFGLPAFIVSCGLSLVAAVVAMFIGKKPPLEAYESYFSDHVSPKTIELAHKIRKDVV